MTKILWFSRHSMSIDQYKGLVSKFGSIEVTQVNGSPSNVHVTFNASEPEKGETVADHILVGEVEPLKTLISNFDEVAVVLPIGLLQQLLPFSKSGRLLQSKNKRILLDEGKVLFAFDGWEAVTKIEIVTVPL